MADLLSVRGVFAVCVRRLARDAAPARGVRHLHASRPLHHTTPAAPPTPRSRRTAARAAAADGRRRARASAGLLVLVDGGGVAERGGHLRSRRSHHARARSRLRRPGTGDQDV